MALLKHPKVEALENSLQAQLKRDLSEKELFSFAPFDAEEAELTGASNYSYWRSTLRAFRKNRVAMFLLLLMLLIVLFTFIQPLLPGQYDAFVVTNGDTGWIGMARFIRNQILIIRDRDYNIASRCLGTSTWRIIVKNLLPYLVSVIMLRMALSIPGAIGSEVFITYIGLGLPATVPSLGNLINEGRKLMMSPSLRYQLIYPTIVLSIVTISFYMIGNAFSDAADPKSHV